jgi:hypothetical protein
MDTKARLRDERKKHKSATYFVTGLVLGLLLGVVAATSSSGGGLAMTPQWAYLLVAFGLGGVAVLAYWWLAGCGVNRAGKDAA